jgi:hypothetical protein
MHTSTVADVALSGSAAAGYFQQALALMTRFNSSTIKQTILIFLLFVQWALFALILVERHHKNKKNYYNDEPAVIFFFLLYFHFSLTFMSHY